MSPSTIISILWLVSCAVLTALGIIFKSPGPEYDGGIYYISFSMIFLGLVYYLSKTEKLNKFDLPISVFVIGVVTVLFSEPLYENDHYRYLWEGNAFLRGENPYLHAPNHGALDHLKFTFRERIGYDHLTTVYPPLAIIWFGLGGIFDLNIGLRILMLFNSVLVLFCFMRLKDKVAPWMLVALFPILIKEFIQAIHIDLLAAFFFLLFMMEEKGRFQKWIVFVLLSIWTKVLGVAALPFILFKQVSDKKEILKRIVPVFVAGISLPLFLEWFVGLEKLKGVREFTIDWVWNPGFYSVLTRTFDMFDEPARQLTGVFYGGFIFFLTLICLREIFLKWTLSKDFCLRMFYLIFAGLMFFTPVYNGWYAIWFIFPALLLNLKTGLLYGIFSVFCYTHYGFSDYHAWAEFITHIWFPLSVYELFKNRHLQIYRPQF